MKKVCLILLVSLVSQLLYGCSAMEGSQTQQLVLDEEPAGEEAAELPEEQGQAELPEEEELPEEQEQAGLPEEEKQTGENGVFKALGASSMHFNYKLLQEIKGDRNIFYSPYSLAGALALANAGAEGETAGELERALGIEDFSAFERDYKEYMEREQSEGARLSTANGIWIKDGLKLADDFETGYKAEAEEYFDAEVKTVDFINDLDSVKRDISAWVREKTENFISDYESGAGSTTVMALINAVYFYGEWLDSFAPKDTQEEEFNGIKGKSTVSLMNKYRDHIRYISSNKGIRAVALPYKDDNIEMEIFISSDEDKGGEILDLVKGLSEEELSELFESLDNVHNSLITRLALPKFELDETFPSLDETLKRIGIEKAYKGRGDFKKIAEEIYISGVNHRARLEVDEEGSRAAAVTEISFEATSMIAEPEEEINFVVNRPFVFFIRDRKANNVLFAGFVRDL